MKRHLALLFALTHCFAARVPAADDAADIQRFIAEYDAAFNAKSMDRLAVFYTPMSPSSRAEASIRVGPITGITTWDPRWPSS